MSKMKQGLYVVMDRSGNQWLCPVKPARVMLGNSTTGEKYWGFRGAGGVEREVSEAAGCLRLPEGERLDESCFDDKGRWVAFKVSIILG